MATPPQRSSLSFRSGFSLGVGAGLVIAQRGARQDPDNPESLIMKWSENGGWSSFEIALTAIRMWAPSGVDDQLFVMGAGGYVAVISGGHNTEEMVDESNFGPRFQGNIRDMRMIGRHLYAVGMSRQVYRREEESRWVHCDKGVVQPLGTLDIAGFCAIDGITELDIYAAGFNGEIWNYDSRNWRRVDSPTNVILHRIRVIEPDLIYACGQEGTLLQGSRYGWWPIEQDVTIENLWGMEWFNGYLYLAGEKAIYRLDGQRLEVVVTGLGASFSYRHLHANKGALWSFGPKHIAKTDGKKWVDLTPRQ